MTTPAPYAPRMHVWRYSAGETYCPWLVAPAEGWEEPPAFPTWRQAQDFADAYAQGRTSRLYGYQSEAELWRAASPEALAEIVAADPEWPYCDFCGEDRVAVRYLDVGACFDCAASHGSEGRNV